MVATRPKPSMLENLTDLGLYVCCYLDDKSNRERIIKLVEEATNQFNTWKNRLKSKLKGDTYYYNRFNTNASVLADLKRIHNEERVDPKLDSPSYNAEWLTLLLNFFATDLWDQEDRPSVMVMRGILKEFTKFDEKKPLPLNEAMETLHVSLKAKALETITEYRRAEENKINLKKDLEGLKGRVVEVEPEVPVIKPYTAPARKKFGKEFDTLRTCLEKIYEVPRLPEPPSETKKLSSTAQTTLELLGPPPTEPPPEPPKPKVVIKVKKELPTGTFANLLDEVRNNKRYKKMEDTVGNRGVTFPLSTS